MLHTLCIISSMNQHTLTQGRSHAVIHHMRALLPVSFCPISGIAARAHAGSTSTAGSGSTLPTTNGWPQSSLLQSVPGSSFAHDTVQGQMLSTISGVTHLLSICTAGLHHAPAVPAAAAPAAKNSRQLLYAGPFRSGSRKGRGRSSADICCAAMAAWASSPTKILALRTCDTLCYPQYA
jgi:hypothetical protein